MRIGTALYVRCVLMGGRQEHLFFDLKDWFSLPHFSIQRKRNSHLGILLSIYFDGDLIPATYAQGLSIHLPDEDTQEVIQWILDSEPYHTHLSSHYTVAQRSISSSD